MPPSPIALRSSAAIITPPGVDALAGAAVTAFRRKSDPSTLDLNRALIFIQQAYRVEASRHVARMMDEALLQFLNDAADNAERIYRMMGAKSGDEDGMGFSAEVHEAVWRNALEQEQRAASARGLFSLPVIESAAAQTYLKAAELFGTRPTAGMLSEVEGMVKVSGPFIVGVVETAKQRVLAEVAKATAQKGIGSGFKKVLKWVRDKIGKIVKARSGTATRTETRRATDIGTTVAATHSWQISHMSVVGCTMIEINGPTYAGFPTCLIRNVPVADSPDVTFHPQHTGFWSVSGFTDENGQPPKLEVSSGNG